MTDILFPEVKFLDLNADLYYSDTEEHCICKLVFSNINYSGMESKTQWWEEVRRWIHKYMAQLRNDRNNAVKNAFLSKHLNILSFHSNIERSHGLYFLLPSSRKFGKTTWEL